MAEQHRIHRIPGTPVGGCRFRVRPLWHDMDVDGDAYLIFCSQATEAECRDTEIGYMGFVNGILPDSPGPFANVSTLYWSSTDYNAANTEWPGGRTCYGGPSGPCAWREGFPVDSQNYVDKGYDGYGVWLVADGDVLGSQQVEIEVNPGRDAQCKGTITVAVLGSDAIDVMQIDPTSLAFDGLGVGQRGNGEISCKTQDTNADGFLDLVCQYVNAATEGALTGQLLDGMLIEGSGTTCAF